MEGVEITINEEICGVWREKTEVVSAETYEILKRCEKSNKKFEITSVRPVSIEEEVENERD